ncbi:PAS domain S-box protein [Rhodocista pekingensis]|uniref:histidine kinase n=1 Tax=Rhodocista pekingensis TaxID=201185 RepID=A0ABW2KRF5_9PROT
MSTEAGDPVTAARVRLAQACGGLQAWQIDPATWAATGPPGVLELFGLPATASVRDILDAIHRRDRPRVRRRFAEACRPGGVCLCDFRVMLPDGGVRWLRLAGEGVVLPDGSLRVVGFTVDITGTRTAARDLVESEARFRSFIDHSSSLIFAKDLQGRYILANRAYLDLFGFSSLDALLGLTDRDRFGHEVDWTLNDRRVAATGEPLEAEEEADFADGRRTYISAKFPLRDAAGRIVAVGGISTDITARKRAEQALAESEARFRVLADSAPVTIWMAAPDGACTYMSRGWRETTGQDEDAAAGFGWLAALHPDDAPTARQALAGAVAGQRAFRQEYRLRHRDGRYRWAMNVAVPRLSAGGDFLGLIGSIMDITERRQLEEARALLMREVDHRAKNALAVVQALVGLTSADSVAAFKEAVTGRVSAMARAHSLLAANRWLGGDLAGLAGEELEPYAGRVRMAGPAVDLPADYIQAVSLSLHELATNAAKHGALSSPDGRVDLRWDLAGGGRALRLVWEESGGPPVAGPPRRSGFGSSLLVRSIRGQLGGTLRQDWRPQGLLCEIVLPLTHDEGGGERG